MSAGDVGPVQPARGALISPQFFTLATAFALSVGVSLVSDLFVSTLTLGHRLNTHRMVVDRQAPLPYQYDMYLVSTVCQWLQDHAGMSLVLSFSLVFSVGYLLLFLTLWACLSRLYRRVASVLIGLLALAVYACLMMPSAGDHAADPFGAALIALTLAAVVRGSPAGVLAASLAGGFLWSKHVVVAPIVLLYEVRRGRWGRGLALAALVVLAALFGPLCYRLPVNPVVSAGVLTPWEWIQSIPHALTVHVGFALPPLLSLLLLGRRLHLMVRTAAWLYPLMIAAYAVAGFFIYELRSFWPVVPAFVALLAAWGDQTGLLREAGDPASKSRGGD